MKDHLYILVSNIGLPSERIGSWVTRINKFNNEVDFFDFILSPSRASKKHLYCKKRAFITWNHMLRKVNLFQWVAKDYIKTVRQLSKKVKKISIVVMDDPHLVEALALRKEQFNCSIEIIYSYHGFQLSLKEKILNKIDKVLFLSNAGYKASKQKLFGFIPEVNVVGNGVDSERFFPLNEEEKASLREKEGYGKEDKLLIWMANERPVKGFHLFKKIAAKLLSKHTNLKIIVLGSKEKIIHPDIKNVGRIPNSDIAKYLQMGDYYMFTSLCVEGFGLSMIEALKTGNVVIASKNGAIEEVLSGQRNVFMVDNPNILEDWLQVFEQAYTLKYELLSKEEANSIWNYQDWKKNFLNAIMN